MMGNTSLIEAPASAEAGPLESMDGVIAELGDVERRAGSLAAACEATAASFLELEAGLSVLNERAVRLGAALEGGAE